MAIGARIRDRISSAFGSAAATIAKYASTGGGSPVANTSRREAMLKALDDLYEGKQYEGKGLAPSWDKLPPGRHVPLRNQQPSAQYDLPKLVVDRPTAMLFGEGRFPEVSLEPKLAGDENAKLVNAWLSSIIEEGALQHTSLIWARQGARIGTAVMTWSIVEGEFEFEAHLASQCTPTFHPKRRGRLIGLEKCYRFKKPVEEYSNGFTVVVDKDFWHRETWDEKAHIVYEDEPALTQNRPATWTEKDVAPFPWKKCPAVWVKNVDQGDPSNVDGVSLNEGLADISEDIDRTLSQKARAVRYNQDPERVYFGLTEDQTKRIFGGGGATTNLPEKPKAAVELLEMNGEGQRVAEEHIMSQRGRALETARVVSPNPETLLAASRSGAALRILFAAMLELVGELRQTYGRGLREILTQIVDAARSGYLGPAMLNGELSTPAPDVIPDGKIRLMWGRSFDPTPEDLFTISQAMNQFKASGVVDRETILRCVSAYLGIKDVAHVLEQAQKEADEAQMSEFGGAPPGSGKREPADQVTKPGKPAEGDGADIKAADEAAGEEA